MKLKSYIISAACLAAGLAVGLETRALDGTPATLQTYAQSLVTRLDNLADFLKVGDQIEILSSPADYMTGATANLPGWIYDAPPKGALLEAGQKAVMFEMVGSKNKEGGLVTDSTKQGLSPRGIAANRQLPLIDPFRYSAPAFPSKLLPMLKSHDGLVTQIVADFMAIKLYKTHVLPRFPGIKPMVYGPSPKTWEAEHATYREQVLAAAIVPHTF